MFFLIFVNCGVRCSSFVMFQLGARLLISHAPVNRIRADWCRARGLCASNGLEEAGFPSNLRLLTLGATGNRLSGLAGLNGENRAQYIDEHQPFRDATSAGAVLPSN